MRTVVDLRGRDPYVCQQKRNRIASTGIAPRRLEIAWYMELRVKPHTNRSRQAIPILQFEGKKTKIVVYVTDCRGFGVLRYYNQSNSIVRPIKGTRENVNDDGNEPTLWLHASTVDLPDKSQIVFYDAPSDTMCYYYHCNIVMVNKVGIRMNINGRAVEESFDDVICPQGETMEVLVDGEDFTLSGWVQNLLVRVH